MWSFPDDCTPLRMRGLGCDVLMEGSVCPKAQGRPSLGFSRTRGHGYSTGGSHPEQPPPGDGMDAPPDPRRTELLLDAVKAAIGTPGEHRLFRSGKLAGLFPSRAGPSADAALAAIR